MVTLFIRLNKLVYLDLPNLCSRTLDVGRLWSLNLLIYWCHILDCEPYCEEMWYICMLKIVPMLYTYAWYVVDFLQTFYLKEMW
jgi:hypothetical protein